VIVIDCHYTILFINQVEDGNSFEDAIGAHALDFVQPEYKERVSQAYDLAFAGKDLAEFEVASWDPAGNPTYYTSRIAPIVEDGKVVAGLITCMNVQNIKDTEASLRADRRALRHLITTLEKERQLVSCEIHDGLSQYLVGAIMLLDAREHQASRDGAVSLAELREGIALLRKAAAESRRLIQGLRPTMLDELGIIEAVRSLVAEARSDIPIVEYSHPGSLPRFEPEVETAIFRIVQESLSNINKHSNAHHVSVSLEQRGEHELAVTVVDDGAGFDISAVPDGRFGLESIRQRSRLFHREALISSSPGQGCRVEVVLPILPRLPSATSDASSSA
jgi:signal transduction histidine kinase